jgi:hypothetical protein
MKMSVTQEEWFAASKQQRAAMFPLSQQSDEAANQLLQRCVQFARDNPSLALTLLYLGMSLMGLLFQTAVLYRFGLNVLPYLEISDFLLSALTHPEVVLLLLLMLLVVAGAFWIERWHRARSFRYAVSTEGNFERWWVPQPSVWMSLLFIIYMFLAAWSNGNSFAKDIRAGKGSQLEILLVYPLPHLGQKVLTLQHASLISRTASYLIIYHEGRVKVLPHSNIAALLPQIKQAQGSATPAPVKKAQTPITASETPTTKSETTTTQSETPPIKSETTATQSETPPMKSETTAAPTASEPAQQSHPKSAPKTSED